MAEPGFGGYGLQRPVCLRKKPLGLGYPLSHNLLADASSEKRPYKPRNLRHYTGTLTDIRPKGDTFYFFDGLDCEHPVF